MEWIRGYLKRAQDQSSVSYARFGRPGDEPDAERPTPTQILVAPFDVNDIRFKALGYWHIERAAGSFAIFGMSMVVIVFICTFFEFNWYHHQRGVDISALIALFTYLALGVLIHYYVVFGIKKQTAYYLLPFIVVYSLLITAECLTIIAVIIKLIEMTEPTRQPFLGYFALLGVSLIVQTLMLLVVLRCREYLSLKENHEMELKIAERSKTQNPGMEIVIAGKTGQSNGLADEQDDQPRRSINPPTSSLDNPVFGV